MATYRKRNGSVTVTDKSGKISGNIGAGKKLVPTSQSPARKPPLPTAEKNTTGNKRVGSRGATPHMLSTFFSSDTISDKTFLRHPGSRAFAEIVLNTNPNVSTEKLEYSLIRLFNEAQESNMDDVVVPESTVYAWIDSERFKILSEFDDVTNKQRILTEFDKLAESYSKDPSTIRYSMVYAWKYAESVAEMEQQRKVNNNAKIIAVDLDGVLYEVETVMHKWLVNQGYSPPLHEIRTYDMAKNWNLDSHTINEEFGKAVDAGLMFRYGDAYPEGVASVKKIYESGHRVAIITARDLYGREDKCHQATLKWLREKGIPFDSLHLTRDKEKVQFDVLIDDAPVNVERVMGWGRRGIILHRQWNKDEGVGYERKTWIDVLNELTENDNAGGLFPSTKIARSEVAKDGVIRPSEGGETARNRTIGTA